MRPQFTTRMGICFAIGLMLAVGLGVPSVAMAGEASGRAVVDSVDLRARVIVMEGNPYRVSETTQLADSKGSRVDLSTIRPRPAGKPLYSDEEVDFVTWRATRTNTGWVLTQLRVLDSIPD